MTFKNPFKPIAIGLSPNASSEDLRLAFSLLLSPSQWVEGNKVFELEKVFQKYLNIKFAYTFDSGRSSLYALLSCLGVGPEDEVLLQAYNCVVVPNAVLWCGAKPRYVDIDEDTLNMSLADLERKISGKSKAIIVQHTFGQIAAIDEIMIIARRHNLLVIEDCAHALGATSLPGQAGTLGDAAFFSFGRDKIISSVHGGIAVTNDPHLGEKLKLFQSSIPFPSRRWIFQQLFHPIAFLSLILPTYEFFSLGKVFLVLLQRLGMLSLAVTKEEKRGDKPSIFSKRMPNALATLALSQMNRLEQFNKHRQRIASMYTEILKNSKLRLPLIMDNQAKSIFLRYNLQTSQAERLFQVARQHRIILGNWYNPAISPKGTEYSAIFYQPGSCPVAERVAKKSLNLPTYPHLSLDDAQRIAYLLVEESSPEEHSPN